MMTSLKIRTGAAAFVALACGGAAQAGMTKDEYKAKKTEIAADYQAERQKCGVRYGNALDMCVARAHGVRDVAKAELEAAYRPSAATDYKAAVARAKSQYAIAKEECDEQKGEMRKKCVGRAKDAMERAIAEAKAKSRSG
jgi:hypothetical protein